jgi:hypothetical protein
MSSQKVMTDIPLPIIVLELAKTENIRGAGAYHSVRFSLLPRQKFGEFPNKISPCNMQEAS